LTAVDDLGVADFSSTYAKVARRRPDELICERRAERRCTDRAMRASMRAR
jgi:hypothetical protein